MHEFYRFPPNFFRAFSSIRFVMIYMGCAQIFEAQWECNRCGSKSKKWLKTWRARRYACAHNKEFHPGLPEDTKIIKRRLENDTEDNEYT